MAQLKDTLVSGNLRVTDTILADILQADSIKGGIVATGTTWNGNTIDEIYGGTGQNTYAKGDLLYASATNMLSKLGANTGTKQFLSMTSSVPSWASIAFADIPSLYIGTTKVQSSSAAQALTGITTLTTSGNATIGGIVTVGGGGFIGSDAATNIYLSNSSGKVFVVDGKVIRRNADITDVTLGSSTYRWGGLYSTTGSFSSTLGVTGNTTLGGTLSVTKLSTLSGGITLGGTYNNASSNLVWDADHSAWHLIGNFYADGFVSSGGLSTGSGASGIDEPGMWLALSKNTTDKIHVSHMPYVAGSASDLTTGTSTTGTIWAAKTIADYVQSQVNTSVTSALYFRGESSTAITNGGTEIATIDGSSLTAKTGDLVLYDGKEFAWDGTKWIQLGDESSWASKTTKIEGTGYLSGGGTLESNRTIDIGTTYKTRIDNGNTAYGYFSNNILPISHGGTGKSTWTQYGIVYASASGTLAQIALPTWAASTTYWLKAVTNSSKVPTYSLATLSKSDVGLGNVENTALSTWAGTNKITTVGTVTTGTWNATAISAKYGGTGMSGDNAFTGAYRIVYTSSATAMTTLAPNTTSTKKFLTMTGTGSAGQVPTWDTVTKSDVGLDNVANSTYAGGTAVTLNGTSKASSTASFYAPTASGTVSEVLLSGGANASPTWAKQSSLSTGFHPKALTSKGTTATTTAGETYGVAGNSTSGKRIFTKWFVNLDSGDTTLVDGMIITFRIPLAGLGTVGECITIDGNEQHFHQVVFNSASFLTTHFPVNDIITVQYDASISSASYGKYDSSTGKYVHNGNTTTAIKGVWRVLSLYDSGNTDIRYQQTIYNINWSVPTDGAIRAYTLCMETPDGKFTSLTTVNSSTGTSKAMYSGYLKPRKVYYWAHTDNYSGGGTITRSNVMLTFNGGLIDYRYTLNCGTTLTAKSPLYLVGTIDNSGFKLDITKPWSCTLPTTEDGKVYIYVGMTYDTYRGSLEENNTIYYYKDGAVRIYNQYAETATKLSTVSKTAWGQTYWTDGGIPATVSGNMSNVGSISMSGSISGATTGSFSSNVTVGGTLTVGTSSANKATTLNGTLSATGNTTIGGTLTVGTSSTNKATTLNGTLSVTGLSTLAGGAKLTTTRKIWFGDDYYLELDSNGYIHTNAGFYSDSFVSAGGLNEDSSGASGIDEAGMWLALKKVTTDKIDASHLPLSVSDGTTETGKYVSGISYSGGVFTVSKASLPSAYSLPVATSDALGGIKIGYTTSGKNYAVVLDTNNRAYVNVPWSYTDTWRGIYTGGTSRIGTGTGTKAINFVAGSNVTISYEAAGTGSGQSGNANYFNVKIAATDTTYSSQAAASGGTAVSLVTTGEKYTWGHPILSIAQVTDTSNVSLYHGNKYKLTVAGSTLVFTMPSDTNTTYTVATGDSNGQIKVTPSSGNAYNVSVKGLGSMAYASTSSYQPAGSYVKYSTTPPANANIADGTNPTVYLLHKDLGTTANTPNAYGLLADFTVSSGHLQFASGLTQNEIKVRSYWWTNRSSTSDPFPGYSSWVTLLHSGNYSSYALPLTGGTISSTSEFPLVIKTSSTQNYLVFRDNDTIEGFVGFYSDAIGMVLQCEDTYINLANGGELKKNNQYTFYHSGNSNLNTVNWTCNKLYAGNASNTDWVGNFTSANAWVGINNGGGYGIYANSTSNDSNKYLIYLAANASAPGTSGTRRFAVYTNGATFIDGATSMGSTLNVTGAATFNNTITCTGDYIYASAGYIQTNYTATNNNASLRIPIDGGNSYGWGINITNTQLSTGSLYVPLVIGVNNAEYDSMSMLFHYVGHNSASNYYGFGFYNHDDLVVLYGSGLITTASSIRTANGQGLQSVYGGSAYNLMYIDSSGNNIVCSGSSTAGLRPTYIYGKGTHIRGTANTDLVTVLNSGNVGINITNPSYLLHVNGTLGVSGAATFGSTLTARSYISIASASGNWTYLRLSNGSINWDVASGNHTQGMLGVANTFEIRDNGAGQGIAIRSGTSSYGKLVVAVTSGESSIGYYSKNNNAVSGYPIWTAGYTADSSNNFGWYYKGSSQGWRLLLSPEGNLSAVGNVAAGTASDERLKTNIHTLSTDSAKDIILKARPVNFTWKDIATELYDGYKGDDIGLIAQEVEELLPQAIGTIFEKYKRLDYTKFIPPIITVIQDHEKRIKELEDIIAKLTEENKHLKEQI